MTSMSQLPADQMERLLAEEPFVRELARHLVAVDADDVVQQTWLRALQSRSGPVERPRHWLARVVRNVAANLRRSDRRRDERELADAVAGVAPSSAELMEREERRRQLVAAVDRLPPVLRAVVLLRFFEGLPPRAIAARLGVPAATVSTQLQRALAQLRQQLDEEHGGDRRAWLLPLMTFARPPSAPLPVVPRGLPAMPALLTGGIAMVSNGKIVAAAVVLATAGAWVFWPSGGAPGLGPQQTGTAGTPIAALSELDRHAKAEVTADAPQRDVVTTPDATAATMGRLVVHLRYGDDHTPVVGSTVIVGRRGGDFRVGRARVRTDANGDARVEGLSEGDYYAITDHADDGKAVAVKGGETTELDYVFEVGLRVTGIVVDSTGVPVVGALVEVAPLARSDFDAEILATTGADGRFVVRAACVTCLVGARAAGYSASQLRFLFGKNGNTADVRIELGQSGGMVDGVVVDPAGKPVADAVVIVGSGVTSAIVARGEGAPPMPALVRSDASGRFLAVGVPLGAQPVAVRAAALAPWQGVCDVAANVTSSLRVQLSPGASVHGFVRNADGPVSGAIVEVGTWGQFLHCRARSGADGAFQIVGLPAGEIEITAAHDTLGKDKRRVVTVAGGSVVCDLQLSRGLLLQGRVLDGNDKPVVDVSLECYGEGGAWGAFAAVDANGHFEVANCPEKAKITVTIHGEGFAPKRLTDVDPRAGELVVRVMRAPPPTVMIVGAVVDPEGKPAANIQVVAWPKDANTSTSSQASDAEGRFRIGPLVPDSWKLSLSCADHPELLLEPHDLVADATWDVGILRLSIGGSAVFEVRGVTPEELRCRAVDLAERQVWMAQGALGRLHTSALNPGDYLLLVSGKGTAAQAVPFSIRAGEETTNTLQLQPGTSQRVECVMPTGFEPKGSVTLRVRRANTLVQRTWASVTQQPIAAELWLAPGTYDVTATVGALTGTATFTVGAEPREPVTVTLR
jgi:RNA polymerase sigma factor (sigma-70 family)